MQNKGSLEYVVADWSLKPCHWPLFLPASVFPEKHWKRCMYSLCGGPYRPRRSITTQSGCSMGSVCVCFDGWVTSMLARVSAWWLSLVPAEVVFHRNLHEWPWSKLQLLICVTMPQSASESLASDLFPGHIPNLRIVLFFPILPSIWHAHGILRTGYSARSRDFLPSHGSPVLGRGFPATTSAWPRFGNRGGSLTHDINKLSTCKIHIKNIRCQYMSIYATLWHTRTWYK